MVVAPRRPALAAVLLTIAMATSGASLAFFLGTALHLLLTRPRALPWLLLPFGIYLAWYLAFGHSGIAAPPLAEPRRRPGVRRLRPRGIGGRRPRHDGPLVGLVACVAIAIAVVRYWPVPSIVVAMLATGVAFFVIAGFVRAELGAEQAAAPRYVYIVAPAFIVAGSILLARLPTRRAPDRSAGAGPRAGRQHRVCSSSPATDSRRRSSASVR